MSHEHMTDAPTVLLLLPGLDGTDVFFRPLMAALTPSIQPMVLSYPDQGPYTLQELLLLAREALAGVSACYVLASSFGGPLGIMLAAAEPARVRGLILCATFARAPRPKLVPFRGLLRAPLIWSLRFLRRLPVWMRSSDDELRRAKHETWRRVSARALAARGRAVLKVDVRDLLATCPQPLLNVAFDQDTVVVSRNADEILAHHRDARGVLLSGGHLAMFDDPAPLAAEIVRFVESGERLKNSAPVLSSPAWQQDSSLRSE
jgi:pimeloyl-ACP methyl ester carboxylesterase